MQSLKENVPVRDSENQEQPVEVDQLQSEDQHKHDRLGNPAFVLLCSEIQGVRTNGAEFCKNRPQNPDVEPVSEVDPGAHEHEEERSDIRRVQVVERLGQGQEKVRYVHRDVDCNSHPGEIESVGQEDQ
ncbi:hypothetical protein OGAPHI_000793 [Ogataea philodendri]|uniref:Uncharacterized protein n=1 Tax=Ogataea philodendri TaxID=1378263 RepID=A0A9P8PGY9_9ASCO|nr:uncharacterized protein OGAPHI_000793 [Ogataea philodendri]KAH3671082.1 hypothetical protein OGAPHI_000793 [Ogataea philodendri]